MKVHAVRYALLMCLLLAAPTSTHGVFTSFSLSQYCCLHFWKNKFGSMLAQGFLRVEGQAQITKCYFLWVDAINMQSLSSHYLMRQQAPMAFSLHLVYLSIAACISEKNKVGSMLQGLDFVPSRENHIWFSPDSFARINWFSFCDKIHNTAESNCYAN